MTRSSTKKAGTALAFSNSTDASAAPLAPSPSPRSTQTNQTKRAAASDDILQCGDTSTLQTSGGGGGGGGGGVNAAAEAISSVRRMQNHILLRRHAAKCPHEDGPCPVTRSCGAMKKLWKHIRGCKDKSCPVKYCAYSRDSLTHYHRCCDTWCPVCLPVRGAIHRAHAKAQAETEKTATRESGGEQG